MRTVYRILFLGRGLFQTWYHTAHRHMYVLRKRWGVLSLVALGVLIGVAGTYFFIYTRTAAVSRCATQYPLTSQSIHCDEYDSSSQQLASLDAKIDAAVALYTASGKVDQMSVFTRDLVTNQYASTNENLMYAPASLMKLPLLISYYKVAELEPSILNTTLTFEPSATLNSASQDFTPSVVSRRGKAIR